MLKYGKKTHFFRNFFFLAKYLDSGSFLCDSRRPGGHARFLETPANSGRLGRSDVGEVIHNAGSGWRFHQHANNVCYVCFMDASKAFDRVNHWTLFKKQIDRGMPDVFVRLLVYWYRTQNACVRWSTACSEMFAVSNGVRQGGIQSPLFFNVYMDGLSDILCRTECGCILGGRMLNAGQLHHSITL